MPEERKMTKSGTVYLLCPLVTITENFPFYHFEDLQCYSFRFNELQRWSLKIVSSKCLKLLNVGVLNFF